MAKRSKGVIIFGILLILGSAIQVLGLRLDTFRIAFSGLPEFIVLGRYAVAVAVTLLSFASGIAVIMLIELFRKVLIYLGFFSILLVVIETPLMMIKNWDVLLAQQTEAIAATAPEVSASFVASMMLVSIVIAILVHVLFWSGVIYFFTRPAVKGQFARGAESAGGAA